MRIATIVLLLTLTTSSILAETPPKSEREFTIQQARCNANDVAPNTARIAGTNRYETAVQISTCMGWNFENTLTVYLANGENFPDALALGPSVLFESGPLLLTTPTSLPAVTRQELEHLQPCDIVAVGGTAAIAASVLEDASQYTHGDC